jgi:transcription elongation factor Elf1
MPLNTKLALHSSGCLSAVGIKLQDVKKCKYLGMTITNQNHTQEYIKFRECLLTCNSESLSSCLVSLKIKIYRIIIVSVALCGSEALSLVIRKKHRRVASA